MPEGQIDREIVGPQGRALSYVDRRQTGSHRDPHCAAATFYVG